MKVRFKDVAARLALGLLVLATTPGPAQADEIRLLASNAVREPYLEVLPEFEKESGHRIIAEWGGTVDIVRRAAGSEAIDVVVIPDSRVFDLAKEGIVTARADLVRSSIGIAGPVGAPRPSLASVDDLKRALVSANTIVLSSGPSSVHMLALFDRVGIAPDIKPKLVRLAPGLSVGEAIAAGKGDIGFTQISELLSVKGIEYLGPLPPEAQSVTVFSAGLLARARSTNAARALIKYLSAPAMAPVLRKHGMEPG